MSGSIGLNTPSYLPALYGGRSEGDSLLATLYGQTGPTPGSTNPIAALEQARSHETKQVAQVAADPEVKRDLARFVRVLAKAKTAADLLSDPIAMKVLLTANGLGSHIAQSALAKQALLSDPAKTGSLASRLPDSRWLSVTKTYAFASKGLTILKDPKAITAVTNGYAEVLWRQKLDKTTPGLSNALDFLNRASTIKDALQVLGDPTFRAVLTTALGVPKQIAFQTIGSQENAITSRVDLKKFSDPVFTRHFAQRYLVAAASEATNDGSGQDLTALAVRSSGLLV